MGRRFGAVCIKCVGKEAARKQQGMGVSVPQLPQLRFHDANQLPISWCWSNLIGKHAASLVKTKITMVLISLEMVQVPISTRHGPIPRVVSMWGWTVADLLGCPDSPPTFLFDEWLNTLLTNLGGPNIARNVVCISIPVRAAQSWRALTCQDSLPGLPVQPAYLLSAAWGAVDHGVQSHWEQSGPHHLRPNPWEPEKIRNEMGSGAMHFVHDERGGCWCGVFWCQDVFEMIGAENSRFQSHLFSIFQYKSRCWVPKAYCKAFQ